MRSGFICDVSQWLVVGGCEGPSISSFEEKNVYAKGSELNVLF